MSAQIPNIEDTRELLKKKPDWYSWSRRNRTR